MTKYSYEVFSEELGLGRNNVAYLIIKGKRSLSMKNGKKIASSLGFSALEKKYWLALVEYQNESDSLAREVLLRKLVAIKAKTFTRKDEVAINSFFSEWWHAVIFELIKLPDFHNDLEWINRRLQNSLRARDIASSMKLLSDLGLILVDSKTGEIELLKQDFNAGDEVKSLAVVRFHHVFMDLAKQSITEVSEAYREINSLTLCIAREDLLEYKREIRTFLRKINRLAEKNGKQNEVYQLNLQFFPLTKQEGDS